MQSHGLCSCQNDVDSWHFKYTFSVFLYNIYLLFINVTYLSILCYYLFIYLFIYPFICVCSYLHYSVQSDLN